MNKNTLVEKLNKEIPERQWVYDENIPAIVAYKDGELTKIQVTKGLIDDLLNLYGVDPEKELISLLKAEIAMGEERQRKEENIVEDEHITVSRHQEGCYMVTEDMETLMSYEDVISKYSELHAQIDSLKTILLERSIDSFTMTAPCNLTMHYGKKYVLAARVMNLATDNPTQEFIKYIQEQGAQKVGIYDIEDWRDEHDIWKIRFSMILEDTPHE